MDKLYGIYPRSYTLLLDELKKYPHIHQVILFGSRAMGNFKKGSDIDLALVGEKISPTILTTIIGRLNEELDIPYKCDVVHFSSLQSEALKKHILEKGVILFERKH